MVTFHLPLSEPRHLNLMLVLRNLQYQILDETEKDNLALQIFSKINVLKERYDDPLKPTTHSGRKRTKNNTGRTTRFISISYYSEILPQFTTWHFAPSYVALIATISFPEMLLLRRALQIHSRLMLSKTLRKSMKSRWSGDQSSGYYSTGVYEISSLSITLSMAMIFTYLFDTGGT